MLLQRSTIGVCHALLRFPNKRSLLVVLRFPTQNVPSCTMWFRQFTKYVTNTDHKVRCRPHSTEHDTHPIAYLISKQVIPYRTRGGCRDQPSALAGIDRRLLLGSIVGFCWDRPSVLAVGRQLLLGSTTSCKVSSANGNCTRRFGAAERRTFSVFLIAI
jgi:hypothetical protein